VIGRSPQIPNQVPIPPPPVAAAPRFRVACPECRQPVALGQAFSRHMVSEHGFKAPEKRFAYANGICTVCRMKFSSRISLTAHLAGRTSQGNLCLRQLSLSSVPPLSHDEMSRLDKCDAARQRQLRSAGRSMKTTERPAYKADNVEWVWIHGPVLPFRPRPIEIT